ncbi:MAG: DUF11 domain-containing protein, partial [Actinomycetota bacterium]|nr:DUF11 domain-containing protein [Actinomycetota bacterium]
DARDPVTLGTKISYTITAKNNGGADATGVKVSDPLPANTTFDSASASQGTGCSFDGAKTSCALGTIIPGASATVTLVVKPTAEGTITNTASVSALEAEDDTTNNSATETTRVDPPLPSLTLTKYSWKPAVVVGEKITYKLTVKENGPATSTGVTLSDPLPPNTSFISLWTNKGTCSFSTTTSTMDCALGTFTPGTTATIWLNIASNVEQMVTNTASVSASEPDADPADNTASWTTKATLLSEYPDKTWQTNGKVDAIVYSGNVAYLAGQFTSVRPAGSAAGTNEVPRNNAAAFNVATGELLSWNPNVNGAVNTMALSADGSTIYLGGEFTYVGGLFRNHIAAVSTATGLPTAWDPNVWAYVKALVLSPDGSRVYIGGNFKTVNGQTRLRLAALNTANRWLVSDFAPRIEYPEKPAAAYLTALALSPDGKSLYVGGVFETVNGEAHKSAAKIDLATGAPVSSWDARIEKKPNREESQVYEIVASGSEVFLCGDFYQVQGALSQNLAVVNDTTAARRAFPATDGAINACTVSGTRLYVGGHFENVRPNPDDFSILVPRNHLASFDIASASHTLWDPYANSIAGVYAFAITPSRLAVGGYFTKIGHWTNQQGFAQFSGTT